MLKSPTAEFRTRLGRFNLVSFEFSPSITHLAMWMGDLTVDTPLLVRIQSSCMTSTALGGIICDCAEQMQLALETIANEKRGLFLYLDEEGRGHGLHQKVLVMSEMNKGEDTVTAFTKRGLPPDIRDYKSVQIIFSSLGIIGPLRLMTNNPNKVAMVEEQGWNILERIPLEIPPTEATSRYLTTKKEKLGHILTMV